MKFTFSFFKLLLVVIILSIVSSAEAQIKQRRGNIDSYEFRQLPRVPNPTNAPYTVIEQEFLLQLRDNIYLDATKFYPSEANPWLPDGYPVVIMCHGYGDRKETLRHFALAQAGYGYVVYIYSMRGQGNSGGLSNLISRTEALDLIEFVDYVKQDSITGSDTSKVLIMGGSQGGMIPYMAACLGMNVKTIISALASPDFASSWIENGSIKTTLLWTIEYTPDSVRYTPQVDRMSDWIYSERKDHWDSLSHYLPIDRDFPEIVQNCQVPILLENSWQDMFFNAYGNIRTMPDLTSFSRYYYGAVMGHGGDTAYAENQWHMNFFNEWFFYWLFGIDNQLPERPRYHYAFTTYPETYNYMWSFVHDSTSVWPPAGINNVKLYFHPKNKLKYSQNNSNTQYSALANSVKRNYTLEDAVYDEFTGAKFEEGFKKKNVIFETDALASELRMLGTPELNLDYYSNTDICQFNFQIYEVKNGYEKFVTSINYTDRYYKKKSRKVKSITGNSHAHIFSAGSKIRVVMTNLDNRVNYPFLGTNPFVLPVMKNGTHRMYLSKNSYLTLPVMGQLITQNVITDTDIIGSEYTFKLEQNYPNPFNAMTEIRFTIPDNNSSISTLKIYDITGREIATLLNSRLNPGLHSVRWNANNLSSGIYFYKLTSGNYSDIKRMVMIK